MHPTTSSKTRPTLAHHLLSFFFIALGAFLAALSIQIFLLPNNLIDGGVIGVALILARLFGTAYFPLLVLILTLPFLVMAYRMIRRTFVLHMFVAVLLFAGFNTFLRRFTAFHGDLIEVVVIGGALLGIGCGLIIRYGGCIDGTEILAILINRKRGFTVGQVVLFINIFVFTAYGLIFHNWHIAVQSLITYIVAFKMIDLVIMGLDELKSATIISSKPKELSEAIMKELGLGLTIMHGRGGFSGNAREILFVIVERLDLADLKSLVLRLDPTAFMAVENLHEVVYGKQAVPSHRKKQRSKILPF